jgi:2-dehydro-3-deoxy-L-rhamnonate dehydrogenase (NAD+)
VHHYDLTGRRAVITGGAEGFGRAMAERFLASGALVSLWDRNEPLVTATARELGEHGAVHHAIVDIAKYGQVEAAVAATVKALGGIDILVANAAVGGTIHKTWEYPIDDWEQVMQVNLTGTFFCCRAVVPVMLTQRYGRIVMIASVAGKDGNPNASAYSASKAGVMALTKSLGKELATENIAVNCITPAAAQTRILEQVTQQHIDFMLSKIPRGRFLKVDELASLATWLASEENSFSTGAVWDLSGGRSTY